jgi:polysaccharide deacetylase 2 family uncharacterized protein YibQ
MRAFPWFCRAVLAAACALWVAHPAATATPPRVAIVFEHAGASVAQLAPIYAMHEPFGLGIFPHERYSARIVRDAATHGLIPLLHLPLEARHPADVGPVTGVVEVRMTDAQIVRVVDDDLASTPGVVGVSSHAGSLATADRRVMAVVLRTIKAHGLWFQENRTAADSVASDVARGLGVRTVLVTTYLDDPPVDIERKVRALIETARRQGAVVAGAHITTGAPEVVARLLPEFRRAGIVFVPVNEFLTP